MNAAKWPFPATSRSNQRASSISAGSITMASLVASAMQPIISDEGKGQGCESR